MTPADDDLDAREAAALLRVRVVRRDGYRCRFQTGPRKPPCGAPASHVGSRPVDDEIVALCLSHALPR